jgi:hypothetical protein
VLREGQWGDDTVGGGHGWCFPGAVVDAGHYGAMMVARMCLH